MNLNKTELISRCKAGDRHALDLLYQQYRSGLLKICKQYTKDDNVAEDLMHDAFVVILTSLDKLKQTDKLETWMTSIVKNVAYHYRQHVKKELETLQQMAEENKTTTEETPTPNLDDLQLLITQLPQGYQQVFRLSVFEGLSHQEISELLGIAPHSSSSQLFHAKRMLRLLIKQSWMLIILLVAIPMAVWYLCKKNPTDEHHPTISKPVSKQQPPTSVDVPKEQPILLQTSSPSPIYQKCNDTMTEWKPHKSEILPADVAVLSDSIPNQPKDSIYISQIETAQTEKEESRKDTIIYPQTPWQPIEDINSCHVVKANRSWKVSLAYNGRLGRDENYITATTIGNITSGVVVASTTTNQFSNWIDYHYYLNTNPSIQNDPEVHSLIKIASQNTYINNGKIVARYEHQLPITLQLMLSRQLSRKVSIETGISYTQLNSTITTGSTNANIQERQNLRFLGIPIRFGWQWYNNSHFTLYTSIGPMLELPIHRTVGVRHFENGCYTFQKEVSPSVPLQWSFSLGVGGQYNVTQYLGIYLEPSVQYFFNEGSGIKTYRTEHPFEFTLPFGFRFHW